MVDTSAIDILESDLRRKGDILDTLLINRTTKNNIIWATDSYLSHGNKFSPNKPITPDLVTGLYSKIIQPRAAKSLKEQRFRTKEKAEVFTPLSIVEHINKQIDNAKGTGIQSKSNWQKYVKENKLEIACGEAPFIVSRYNPTAHTGKIKNIKQRVGFLDRKLQIITKHCNTAKKWLYWAKEAYKASYGYEWQGDNVLIARENLFYTLLDYYEYKFSRKPSLEIQQEFAEIISWNIFQMDGLKYVIPMSCRNHKKTILGKNTIYGSEPDQIITEECPGCTSNNPFIHNGDYVKIMDWQTDKPIKFISLFSNY